MDERDRALFILILLTVAAGRVGMGCETGSRPSLMRFALSLSFSQAVAKICSACTEVKCAGVGLA